MQQLDRVRVLGVEDDVAGAKLLSVLLNQAGAEVRVVHSAEEALKTMIDFAPRVIVLDLMLPGMSGLELARRVKSSALGQNVAIIAVSVVHSEDIEREARAFGCVGYIRKPIDTESFATTLASYLGGMKS